MAKFQEMVRPRSPDWGQMQTGRRINAEVALNANGGGGGDPEPYLGKVHADLSKANSFASMSSTFKQLGNQLAKISAGASGGGGRGGSGGGGSQGLDWAVAMEASAATREALRVERDIFEGVSDGSIDSLEKLFPEVDVLFGAAQVAQSPKVALALVKKAEDIQGRYATGLLKTNEVKRQATLSAESGSVMMSIMDNIEGMDEESFMSAIDMGELGYRAAGFAPEVYRQQVVDSLSMYALQNAGTAQGEAMADMLETTRRNGRLTPQSPEALNAYNQYRAQYDAAAVKRMQLDEALELKKANTAETDIYNALYADTIRLSSSPEIQERVQYWESPAGFQDLRDFMGDQRAAEFLQQMRNHVTYTVNAETPKYQKMAQESHYAASEYKLRMQRFGDIPTAAVLESDPRLIPSDVSDLITTGANVRRALNEGVAMYVNEEIMALARLAPANASWSGGVVRSDMGVALNPTIRPFIEGRLQEAAVRAYTSVEGDTPEDNQNRAMAVRTALESARNEVLTQGHLYGLAGTEPRFDGPNAVTDPEVISQWLPQMKKRLFSAEDGSAAVSGTRVGFNRKYYESLPVETRMNYADALIRQQAADNYISKIKQDEALIQSMGYAPSDTTSLVDAVTEVLGGGVDIELNPDGTTVDRRLQREGRSRAVDSAIQRALESEVPENSSLINF